MKEPRTQPISATSHDVALDEIETRKLTYLVYGVAPHFRGDNHDEVKFLFGWNSSLQEVRFSEPYGPVFTQMVREAYKITPRYVWASESPVYLDNRPDRGLYAFNIERPTTFQVGDYHDERCAYLTVF